MSEVLNLDIESATMGAVWYRLLKMREFKCEVASYRKEVYLLLNDLLKTPREELPNVATRKSIVELICEEYYTTLDNYPETTVLSGLADYIMLDYIKSVNKCNKDINSFHTEKQSQRRSSREFLVSTNDTLLDFLHGKHNLDLDSLHKVNKIEMGD